MLYERLRRDECLTYQDVFAFAVGGHEAYAGIGQDGSLSFPQVRALIDFGLLSTVLQAFFELILGLFWSVLRAVGSRGNDWICEP